MNDHLDPEKLKIPAYMRKKAIVRQSKQKLILTALDRKQAGLSVHSQKALAEIKTKQKVTIKKVRATSYFKPSLQDTWPASHPNHQHAAEHHEEMDIQPSIEPTQHQAPTGFAEIHPIGHVTAYIESIQVAIILLKKPLRQDDIIQITAADMLFQQPVDSMQLNRKPIKLAKKGAEIGLKVSYEPQINGTVYKVQI